MHPAFSVIFFTTATGAGYGLLALLGVFAAFGLVPPDRWFGFVSLGLSLGLITAGLLSSTLHLGRPERAWRAFSQWRSSWLSREGVASVATYIPAVVFAFGWVLLGQFNGGILAAGLLAAVGAVITVVCTGMIYASLKPIGQWASAFTLPAYLIYALMTGSVLLAAIFRLWGISGRPIEIVALAAIVLGWAWKIATWRSNDTSVSTTTANSATGLAGGTVRSMEWPHTEENYVLKEMGYRIGRKHATKVRLFVHVFAFAIPFAATALAVAIDGPIATFAALIAVASQVPGMLAERWLLFAEAKHTVTLYYGR
jgi:DMSO reductase anchor subunit